MALPVDPAPGATSSLDQCRTMIAPVGRFQPLIDRRIVARYWPSQRGERGLNGRGVGKRATRCGALQAAARAGPGGVRCQRADLTAQRRAGCRQRSWWAAQHGGGQRSLRQFLIDECPTIDLVRSSPMSAKPDGRIETSPTMQPRANSWWSRTMPATSEGPMRRSRCMLG